MNYPYPESEVYPDQWDLFPEEPEAEPLFCLLCGVFIRDRSKWDVVGICDTCLVRVGRG